MSDEEIFSIRNFEDYPIMHPEEKALLQRSNNFSFDYSENGIRNIIAPILIDKHDVHVVLNRDHDCVGIRDMEVYVHFDVEGKEFDLGTINNIVSRLKEFGYSVSSVLRNKSHTDGYIVKFFRCSSTPVTRGE